MDSVHLEATVGIGMKGVRNNLRETLAQTYVSAHELSKLTGISYVVIRRLLSGGGDISLSLAQRICDTLGRALEDVFQLTPANDGVTRPSEEGS